MKSDSGRNIFIRYEKVDHFSKNRHDYYIGTIAIEMPTFKELSDMVNARMLGDKTFVELRYGYATRNPKENFIKKTGREIAIDRLGLNKPSIYSLGPTIYGNGEEIGLCLKTDGDIPLHFNIKNSKVVFMGLGNGYE